MLTVKFQERNPNVEELEALPNNTAVVYYDSHEDGFLCEIKFTQDKYEVTTLAACLDRQQQEHLREITPIAPLGVEGRLYRSWNESDYSTVTEAVQRMGEIFKSNKQIHPIKDGEWEKIIGRHTLLPDLIRQLEITYLKQQKLTKEDFNPIIAEIKRMLDSLNTGKEVATSSHPDEIASVSKSAFFTPDRLDNLKATYEKKQEKFTKDIEFFTEYLYRFEYLSNNLNDIAAYEIVNKRTGINFIDHVYQNQQLQEQVERRYRAGSSSPAPQC